MVKPVHPDELDAVLEKALDDFDEDVADEGGVAGTDVAKDVEGLAEAAAADATRARAAGAGAGAGSGAGAGAGDDTELSGAMASLMAEMQKPAFSSAVENSMRELSGDGVSSDATGATVLNPFAGTGVGAVPPPNDVDKSVAQTLELMAGMSRPNEGVDPAATEAMGEDVMKQMMEGFEKMGEKEDFQSIIDGMMKQLLSKDIMYLPMKQICEKFPEWLADNEPKMAKEEYDRYGQQYQFFQRIVAVYETEPDNFSKLMELMQDMQETGQPPAEIIKELAPGLEFNEAGMPMLPNMGAGIPGVPTIPGMGGMPGAPGAGCAIM